MEAEVHAGIYEEVQGEEGVTGRIHEGSATAPPLSLSKLEQRVVLLGVCPKCHEKSLRESYRQGVVRYEQCVRCHRMYRVREKGDE